MSVHLSALIAELEAVIRESPRDELPQLAGDIERLRAAVTLRLSERTPDPGAPGGVEHRHEELLGIDEAARRLGISKDDLYRTHGDYPFTRRVGHRLRFSARELDEYIRGPALRT